VIPLFVASILLQTPVSAQFNSGQMQQRFKKNTQGTSIEDYVRKLSSAEPSDRLEVVKLLGATRDPKGVPYLIQSIGDTDVRVQAKSIEMLGLMRATESTQVLIQQLFLRNTEPQMKQRILASLGEIGDDRATKPIMEFLQRDLDVATRGTAVYALGEIGSTEAADLLKKISTDDQDASVRRIASDAVYKVEHFQAAKRREAHGPAETFLPKPPQPEHAQQ